MKHHVIVYSTPTCPYCVYAKSFLTQKGISFEDVDVAQDRSRALEMIQKSGQMGVPVIDVDGRVIVGFQQQLLSELLS